jgi:nucleoside-diphosphate-sugar epimerase
MALSTTGNAAAIDWVAADLTDASTLKELPGGITHVLYAPAPQERSQQAYRRIFVDGLANLLSALDGQPLKRVVFVSSSAVYGPDESWVDETTPARPDGYRGETLLEAEHLLAQKLAELGVAFRLAGLYGPGRTLLLDRLRQGRATVPQAPQWANRFHIEDAARACVHLLGLSKPLPCYVGVDDRPMPIDELYGALAAMLGVPPPARSQAATDVASKRLSNARLKKSGFRLKWPDALEGYRALIS